MSVHLATRSFGLLFAMTWSLSALAQEPPHSPVSGRYSHDIRPLFDAKCVSCHSGDNAPKYLKLDSWENLIAGGRHGGAIIPYDGKESQAIRLMTRTNAPPHPAELEADTLSTAEIDVLRQWIDDGAPSDDGVIPYSDSDEFVYACNEGSASISVIDVKRGLEARRVDLQALGYSDQAKPHHVAVEPDGSAWYVSLIGDDRVLKFDRSNNLVAELQFERPGLLALDATSDYLYVGRSMKAVNPPQRIGIIKRSTMEIEEVDVFIPRPHAITVGDEGKYVYTSSLAVNQVVTLDAGTLEADLLNIPGSVHVLVQFARSNDGKTLVAGGHVSGTILFFSLADPAHPELVDSLHVGGMPWHPAYSRDGSMIYFPTKGSNGVAVVDASTRGLLATIAGRGLAQPHGSGLSLDGTRLFVTSNNLDGSYAPRYDFGDNAHVGTVVMIDTESRRILKVIEVGENTSGLGAR